MTRRRGTRGANPETGIVRACMDLLACHPQVAWAMRTNAGLAWGGNVVDHPTLGRILTDIHPVHLSPKGTQDITSMFRGTGQLLVVEAKTKDGELSDDQERHLQMLSDNGARVLIVRSVGELADDLAAIFQPPKGMARAAALAGENQP